MRALLFFFGLALLASPVAAVEAEEAKRLVQGSWTNFGNETIVFDGHVLDIYSGGNMASYTVTFETMPANMARMRIMPAGEERILRFGEDGKSMWVTPKGEEQGAFFMRLE